MISPREETLEYCERLQHTNPQVRHFLVCTESNIPVWSKIYHWFLDRYQDAPHVASHCFVGVVDVESSRLHMFECDWYEGITYNVLCPHVYIIPRDIPNTYSLCISDTDEVFLAIECTDKTNCATLFDMVDRYVLASRLSLYRMSPLTLLKVYLGMALDRFVCTSFAEFMLSPHSINYHYPQTVDQLVNSYLSAVD